MGPNLKSCLCRGVKEAIDGIGDLGRRVLNVLGRILGEEDVGILLVEAVVLRADVLLVVSLQALAKFDICRRKKEKKNNTNKLKLE